MPKVNAVPEAPKEKHEVTLDLYFEKKSGVDFDISSFEIGQNVTIKVTGKVRRLSSDQTSKSFGMTVTSIKKSGESASLSEDIKRMREERTNE